ncbi:cell division protein DivIVA, partial [Actinotignum timonense]|nr:cell division protein DivIVA [Actinotignum timonense]
MADFELFPTVRKGYDKAQVDERIHQLADALAEARSRVAGLDAQVLRMSGELTELHSRLREDERPSYSGLGTRVERLLRGAEQQAMDVMSRANSDAELLVSRARSQAENLTSAAEKEAQETLDSSRTEAAQVRQRA